VDAANKRWSNMFGGAFNAGANWSGGVPGSADIAEFGVATLFTPGTYTVDFDVSPTNQAIHVEDDIVTFDLNGRTYTTTLFVGNEIGNLAGRTGQLTITDGAWRVDTALDSVYIGAIAGANGSLTISTTGQLTGSPTVYVGLVGTGALTVENGGDVFAATVLIGQQTDASGTVDVIGTGSTLSGSDVRVGQFGTGAMNITAGGFVQSTLHGIIGSFADATGTVLVDGANSRWIDSGPLTIGGDGDGTLNVTATAQVQNTDGYIGASAGGTGMVTIAGGSIWTNTGNLFIGDAGHGELTIEASGNVFNSAAIIGNQTGTSGMVTVDGAGSDWISSAGLRVGNLGQGSLIVTAGGAVSSTDAEIGEVDGITSTATVDGTDSIWTVNGSLDIGDAGDGSLTISNGGTVTSTSGELADGDTADGFVTVTGAGSSWTMDGGTGSLFVGEDGTGTLNILDGGLVSNTESIIGNASGSTGTALISGSDSTWTNIDDLSVGRFGAGELTIADGGSVANRVGYIGREAASSGMATVTGAVSTWTNTNFLYVGYGSGGEGSLSVEAGGAVTCTTGFVGNVAGSHGTATVDGLGSTWTTTGTLAVGNGALTISNGGSVVTNGLFGTLAAESVWNADVTVVGQGSSWSLAGALLTVGFDGAAAINILDGGNVVNLDARLAAGTGSTGAVLVSGAGSTWTIGGRLGVGGDAGTLVSGGTGTLHIQPGASVNVAQNIVVFSDGLVQLEGGTLDAEEISLQGGGQFDFDSGTLHVRTFNSSLVNHGGTLAPGRVPPDGWSAGATTIIGSYAQQSDAMLQIEIGGTAPGAFDVVNVGTIAGISGQLQLALIDGFEPAAGDAFTVLTTAGGIFGTFANVANGQRLTTTGGLGSFVVNYGAGSLFDDNQIVLSNFLAAADLGDYNFEGAVDAADYVVWRKGVGVESTLTNYNLWLANYGTALSAGTSGGPPPAPEPAAAMPIMVAALWVIRRPRRATTPVASATSLIR